MHHPAAHPDFWHARWSSNQIGFHEGQPNRHLVQFWPGLAAGRRVLVPLCGKSSDLAWLAAQGHQVVGVELSPVACAAFFAERGITPEQRVLGPYTSWEGEGIQLLQGDIFDLTDADFDAVWDRAAMIALPPAIRARYAPHVQARLREGGVGLLVTMSYDQAKKDGPPFSVPDDEVRGYYAAEQLLHLPLDEARFADVGGATESVWRYSSR